MLRSRSTDPPDSGDRWVLSILGVLIAFEGLILLVSLIWL